MQILHRAGKLHLQGIIGRGPALWLGYWLWYAQYGRGATVMVWVPALWPGYSHLLDAALAWALELLSERGALVWPSVGALGTMAPEFLNLATNFGGFFSRFREFEF